MQAHGSFTVRAVTLATLLFPFLASVCGAQTLSFPVPAPSIKVGDQWHWERSDRRTGQKEGEVKRQVTAVTTSQIEGTDAEGRFITTPELNLIESSTARVSEVGRFLSFPLEADKKWDFNYAFTVKSSNANIKWQVNATVVGIERVKVPAGEFDAVKIEYRGVFNNYGNGRSGRIRQTFWYAPSVRGVVRNDFEDGYNMSTTQLLSFKIEP